MYQLKALFIGNFNIQSGPKMHGSNFPIFYIHYVWFVQKIKKYKFDFCLKGVCQCMVYQLQVLKISILITHKYNKILKRKFSKYKGNVRKQYISVFVLKHNLRSKMIACIPGVELIYLGGVPLPHFFPAWIFYLGSN